jgi:small subunit ribosomal protein S17
MKGVVVAAKSAKTVAISVERVFQHPTYKKIIRRKKKYLVHDETNRCKLGDLVSVKQVRPISKSKRWIVVEIIESDKEKEVKHDTDAN